MVAKSISFIFFLCLSLTSIFKVFATNVTRTKPKKIKCYQCEMDNWECSEDKPSWKKVECPAPPKGACAERTSTMIKAESSNL